MEVRNRLTMLGRPVALRKRNTEPGRVGWVVIYPQRDRGGPPNGTYRVRSFEVPAELVAQDASIWDGNMESLLDSLHGSIEDAEDRVRSLGEDPEAFDAPWHVDLPA